MRQRLSAHNMTIPGSDPSSPLEITSLKFDPTTALQVAIGTEKGKVHVYDLRKAVPIYTLSHHYRLPIK